MRALLTVNKILLVTVLASHALLAASAEKTSLHFERVAGGIAEEGFELHCGKPSAGQCEVVMMNHSQPQESATIAEKDAREWISKFAAATKSLPAKRTGTVVIGVSYTLDGKMVQADLTTEDRKAGSNPLARAFVALEEKLRNAVAANP